MNFAGEASTEALGKALAAVLPSVSVMRRPIGHNLRWYIIAVITLLVVTSYLDRGNLSVAAPLIMHDLGIGNTAMGVVLSAFVWPYALMNLPSGWLIDWFGPKPLMALAAGLWSIVSVLTGFAGSVAHFVGLRVALGVSEAPLFPGALKATNTWFPFHEKAAATSLYIAATQLGLAVSPLLATALMMRFGWHIMFVAMGSLGFVALLGWLIIYREPANHPWLSCEELDYIRAGQHEPARQALDNQPLMSPLSGREWTGLFGHASIWIMIIGAFCLQYVFWFYISWLPTYLQREQHVALADIGAVSSLPFIAGAVGVLCGGKLSDWLVTRGVAPFTARRSVVAMGGLLTAAPMLATVFASGTVTIVGLLTLGMFTYSLASGCFWALASEVVETARGVGSVGSIQNFGGFLGGACAPIVTGMIIDRFGGFQIAIAVTAALALISAGMYGVLLRRQVPL